MEQQTLKEAYEASDLKPIVSPLSELNQAQMQGIVSESNFLILRDAYMKKDFGNNNYISTSAMLVFIVFMVFASVLLLKKQ